MQKVRPIFKWAGGKYNCIERIVAALPSGKRLIEPFAGAATVFFNTDYPSYLLGESNPDLIHFYQKLTLYQADFIAYCAQYFTTANNSAKTYYRLRDEFNHSRISKKRAALFLYLNRHGYNGLCRYSKSGVYNVPFGHHKAVLFPENALRTFINRETKVELVCADFRATFKQAQEGDIIYCDPPYVPATANQQSFNYHTNGFSMTDQIELAQLAQKAKEQGIPVLISNHDTQFTRAQYANANVHTFPVKRAISCKGQERHPVSEILAVFSPE